MKTIRRSTKVYCKKLNGQWYLLKDKKRYVYVLNKTAGRIWDLASNPITIQEIINTFSKEYQIDGSSISLDINRFIQTLVKEGYLV